MNSNTVDWVCLEAIGTALSALFAFFALWVAIMTQTRQSKLEKSRFIFDVLDHTKEMRELDVSAPNTNDLITNVNSLERVAISWENRLSSRNLINITLKNQYIRIYEQIASIKNPVSGIGKTGIQILEENPLITSVYHQFGCKTGKSKGVN